MSDLITTTQDTYRDKCIGLYVGMLSAIDALQERARENRGRKPLPICIELHKNLTAPALPGRMPLLPKRSCRRCSGCS